MTSKERNLNLYLEDIFDCIKSIENFSKGLSKTKFLKDELRQSAIIRKLEIIGEATKHIPNTFRDKYPFIEWKKMVGMRDILIHAYASVKLDSIWEIIKKELPRLKKEISQILKDYHQKN